MEDVYLSGPRPSVTYAEHHAAVLALVAVAGGSGVTVTENIDETPSGSLMHGIMSSIAEFYSLNLVVRFRGC